MFNMPGSFDIFRDMQISLLKAYPKLKHKTLLTLLVCKYWGPDLTDFNYRGRFTLKEATLMKDMNTSLNVVCQRLKNAMKCSNSDGPETTYARLLSFRKQMQSLQAKIIYSTRYSDEYYEYRHAFLPMELSKMIPKHHLLSESEWRNLGIQQSIGWEHYMSHNPEPHILLFRRPVHRS